ncbi:MAG: sporulation transcription factor Spo0A [Bacilli bacterium]
MKNIRILIVDDNVNLVGMLKECFEATNEIEVIAEAYNGLDGFELIKREKDNFNLLLLDLIMPKKDGIWVLDQMRKNDIKVKTLVETSYNSPDIIREVSESGAYFYILKPFEVVDVRAKVFELMNVKPKPVIVNKEQITVKQEVTEMLHAFGIPSHIKGYQYIRDSIMLLYANPDLVGGITKELYPEISLKYNTTVSRVERAIRHAIEISCNRGNSELLNSYFGYSMNYDKCKPTNSEFLVTISDYVRMNNDQKCTNIQEINGKKESA